VPGNPRLTVRNQLLADVRAQSVGADQGLALQHGAALAFNPHRIAILPISAHPVLRTQFDQFAVAAGVEQHSVQVGAMYHRIGIAEVFAEFIIEWNGGDRFAVDRVHEAQTVDVNRPGAGFIADAKVVKAVKGIRTDLDAGANLAKFGGAFEHYAGNSLARQSERGGQSADAAAGDNDRKLRHRGGLLLPGVAESERAR